MHIDFEFITVRRHDGSGRTTKAIETFDCVSGRTLAITRSKPFETRAAWIDRATNPAMIAANVTWLNSIAARA